MIYQSDMMAERMTRIQRIYADFYHAFGAMRISHELHEFSRIQAQTSFAQGVLT